MPPQSYSFPRSRRLAGKLAFSRVFDAKVRESRGPLMVYAHPNDLPHPRLGISIGRKVGSAPKRNRIKRLLRESFRLMQHDLPRGYDFVVVVRPQETQCNSTFYSPPSTLAGGNSREADRTFFTSTCSLRERSARVCFPMIAWIWMRPSTKSRA
jgi:ribonuclease P protein component